MRTWKCLTLCALLAGIGCQQESGIVEGLEKAGAKVARGLDDRPKSVRFSDAAITSEVAEQLKGLSTLQEVHGSASGLSDEQTATVAGLPQLVALSLLDSDAASGCVKAISESQTLKDVDLSGSRSCTDDVIKGISGQAHLRVLKLDRTPLTDASAEALGSLSNLEELSLVDTQFSIDGIRALSEQLPNLKSLHIQSSTIDDSVVDVLVGMKNLETLGLSGCAITGTGLSALSELKKLRKLLLADCPGLTNDAVLSLGTMEVLEELDVSGSQFSGEGFNKSGFAKLSTLLANRTQVTNDRVGHFTGTPVLYSVQVYGTPVTEEGVRKHFAPTSQTNWAWDR